MKQNRPNQALVWVTKPEDDAVNLVLQAFIDADADGRQWIH
jgi:hypothetical protein